MLREVPKYAKYIKDIVANKRRLTEFETGALTEECTSRIQHKLLQKLKDLGSFTIPVRIGEIDVGRALCDLGASINLMPLSVFKQLGLGAPRPTMVLLQLADRSYVYPEGVIEDVLLQIGKFIFPADFIILDYEADELVPIILGRPLLATGDAIIKVREAKTILRVDNEDAVFNVYRAIKLPRHYEDLAIISVVKINEPVGEPSAFKEDALEKALMLFNHLELEEEVEEMLQILDASCEYIRERSQFEPLDRPIGLPLRPSVEEAPKLEEKLLRVLREHKHAIGWTMSDIKGISPGFCMHKILMEEGHKPSMEHQRRLNPIMKEVVRKEVIKWLDTVNEQNELIPTRTVTGRRICIDYRKLNNTTRKDHFPLPFIDQMLDRLAGQEYYCFLDGYSGYNQIAIAPKDQEKTSFTCPYGTYAFKRMPFGLCNAIATFERSEETNLVLNWEKCHFMVREGIVLGHKVSKDGLEVDKAKVEAIEKLPPPISVKGVRSFLGHAGAEKKLVSAPIIVAPDWKEPFELMFDASDGAIGAVLGQRRSKIFYSIYYASKTVTPTQISYTVIEKELLAVVWAFDKFWAYLVGTKVIVYTDHTTMRYLFEKKDAKPRLIRWVLLLREFDLEILDRKGTENQVTDHLSRLETWNQVAEGDVIKETFPDEQLLAIATGEVPWYADFVNNLAA
ncbi:uncharacterized protein LOC142175774 [Nicotiana tabacum]|uniref:Uncharacterized protein LOC142175774 n=1 Tax=Nicotiana tabacum TaxID=4097 RepID=A0AC58TNQ9_TOBAC